MEIPNLLEIVEAVHARGWNFRTKEGPNGLCAYSHAVLLELHDAEPRLGCLKKSSGQNHCNDAGLLRGVDVAMWLPDGRTVDFIISAGFGPLKEDGSVDFDKPAPANTPCWLVHEGDSYPPDMWFAPGSAGPGPSPEPPPGELDLRVAVLEREMAQVKADNLTQAMQIDNLTAIIHHTIIPRLHWLETGQTGPEHVGKGYGEIKLVGLKWPVEVAVKTTPLPKTDA